MFNLEEIIPNHELFIDNINNIDNFETTAVPVINAAISPYPQGPTMDNTDKAPNISIQIKYFLRFSKFPPNGLSH